jgi:hypothetical protein
LLHKNYHKSKNKAIYDTSAYFIENNERIELVSTGKSFFQSGINLGSFSIGFWIYPSTFSNNEIILKIGSEYYDKNIDTIEDQSIIAKMIDGKLIWEFNNIFSTNEIKVNSIKLESYSRIVPEKWSYINLIYDSNTGILVNEPVWNSSGQIGGAVQFDGSNDYINCGQSNSLNLNIITVEAWVKTNSTSAGRILSKENAGNEYGYKLNMESSGYVSFVISSTTSSLITGSTTKINDDKWHHVVGIKKDDAANLAIYIDGVLEKEETVKAVEKFKMVLTMIRSN